MSHSRVVIYSNGIADFQRTYEVFADGNRKVTIPVRQDHLADVLASFNIYGDVKLESPPTYRPSNELEGSISINPNKVLEDLAVKLSGARIRIAQAGGELEGILVGLHQEEEATSGEPIHPQSIIVLGEGGLRRCLIREVESFKFLDEDVQDEITKALQRNYQKIKPGSTFVDLELSSEKENAEAIVQYTIPAAAWKISYRLRINESQPTELQGFAIVDNNTDEDWKEFLVCVVTGEPITFSTDLADSKIPDRKHLDLVSENALGAVEVARGVGAVARGGSYPMDDALAGEDVPLMSGFGSGEMVRSQAMPTSADFSSAEVHEVGDFNIFEAESPVDIPAMRSTVIPVFNKDVSEAKSVVYYKFEKHPTRPFRAVEFVNDTGISLGRGVCTVYEQNAYAGSCVIPALKPGESRLLPHALESGINVLRVPKDYKERNVAIEVSDGICVTSVDERWEFHFEIKNSQNKAYEIVLDHDFMLAEPLINATLIQVDATESLEVNERLSSGVRFKFSLGPSEELKLIVNEQKINDDTVSFFASHDVDRQFEFLQVSLIRENGPLANDKDVQACIKLYQDLRDKSEEVKNVVEESKRLAARQTRLRENIKAGGQDDLTARWRRELDNAENLIQEIEEKRMPKLKQEESSLRSKFQENLRKLTLQWRSSD